MPFHDVFMVAFATWVRDRELARCQIRQDQIRECLQHLRALYMREPVNLVRRQQYWDLYVSLRCHLVELAAEEVVCEWMYGWAVAYLAVRPMVHAQCEHTILSSALARFEDTRGWKPASLGAAEVLRGEPGASFVFFA
ncbi:hypothetical protein E8E12_006357 [Didymella heteroderae]|uniref:Uncharacterized protein n=1 Tax=Didymella heteroderae TaxID=1769908 RepID=A0A9P5BZS8_9PLEO|nr:hypothetical protein E8E12_006357 [Didymella heteroderae]